MKYEGYGLLGYEIFFKKFVKPSGPPPTYLMYAPLLLLFNRRYLVLNTNKWNDKKVTQTNIQKR